MRSTSNSACTLPAALRSVASDSQRYLRMCIHTPSDLIRHCIRDRLVLQCCDFVLLGNTLYPSKRFSHCGLKMYVASRLPTCMTYKEGVTSDIATSASRVHAVALQTGHEVWIFSV